MVVDSVRVEVKLRVRTRLALWLWRRGFIRFGRTLMPGPGDCHSFRIVASLAAITVAMVAGCAPARCSAPARIEATITAFPPITIARHPVVLIARLIDPESAVPCPRITWTWPDGTRSSRLGDCDPDDRTSGHVDIVRAILAAGHQQFSVTFDSGGREWSAQRIVEIVQ
jgi:hypothetical protein